MSVPFVRHDNGFERHFSSFEEFDAFVFSASQIGSDVMPGWVVVNLCHDCGEELKADEEDYCAVCSEDREHMCGEDYFGDHGPMDSDPYDREPGAF